MVFNRFTNLINHHICLFVYLFIEGEKHQCERETLMGCLSHTPWLGTIPTAQPCAPTGNWTSSLLLDGVTNPTNWATLVRAPLSILKHFYHPQTKPHTHKQSFPIPPSLQPLVITYLLSLWICLLWAFLYK